MATGEHPALIEALRSSQRLGMIGSRPLPEVLDHCRAFVDAVGAVTGTVIDLGAGGGVPGLVIAVARCDLRLVLVDRRTGRADHLRRLVSRLDLGGRVEVLAVEASSLATAWRGRANAVVARGFAPPAVTLATAVPLLAPDGLVVISEPPPGSGGDRWPVGLLDGLEVERRPSDRRVAVFARRGST